MVSVVCAWSSALTRTTVCVAGHTTVLGACGSLIIGQLGIRPAGGRLIVVVLVRPRCPYRLRYLARLRKLIEVNRRYCRFIHQMTSLYCKFLELTRVTKLTLTLKPKTKLTLERALTLLNHSICAHIFDTQKKNTLQL